MCAQESSGTSAGVRALPSLARVPTPLPSDPPSHRSKDCYLKAPGNLSQVPNADTVSALKAPTIDPQGQHLPAAPVESRCLCCGAPGPTSPSTPLRLPPPFSCRSAAALCVWHATPGCLLLQPRHQPGGRQPGGSSTPVLWRLLPGLLQEPQLPQLYLLHRTRGGRRSQLRAQQQRGARGDARRRRHLGSAGQDRRAHGAVMDTWQPHSCCP